jgi:hypothetical protein
VTFSAVSDTRCSTYLIFTAFLTAGCSTIELLRNGSRTANTRWTAYSKEGAEVGQARGFRSAGQRQEQTAGALDSDPEVALLEERDVTIARQPLGAALIAVHQGDDRRP